MRRCRSILQKSPFETIEVTAYRADAIVLELQHFEHLLVHLVCSFWIARCHMRSVLGHLGWWREGVERRELEVRSLNLVRGFE